MENIFPLILIIIVFNVISAILKAFRGGKGAVHKAPPSAYLRPEQTEKIKLWVDDSFEEITMEPDYETAEASAESFAAPTSPPPLPETVYRRPPEQKTESARGTRVTTDGETSFDHKKRSTSPANVFASENSFLSAYIFHEILQPPVSMRKKN